VNSPGIFGYDPTKLVVDVAGLHTTGQAATAWLRSVRHLNPEFSDLRRIIFSITTGDDDADIEVLVDALRALAAESAQLEATSHLAALWPRESPPLRRTPRQGFGKRTVAMPVEQAVGAVTAEMIVPYPPGVPLLVPGELVTDAVLGTLAQLLDAGCHVVGMADPTGASIRCLADAST
jgi:arginine/lysine/ornithine decarboxylase